MEVPGRWFLAGTQDPKTGDWTYHLENWERERDQILAMAEKNLVFCPQRRGEGGIVEWLVTALPARKKGRGEAP